jgi:hypothetical protein
VGSVLSLAETWDLAQAWYADRLSRDWRRRTPEEATALFRSLGLEGQFWEA